MYFTQVTLYLWSAQALSKNKLDQLVPDVGHYGAVLESNPIQCAQSSLHVRNLRYLEVIRVIIRSYGLEIILHLPADLQLTSPDDWEDIAHYFVTAVGSHLPFTAALPLEVYEDLVTTGLPPILPRGAVLTEPTGNIPAQLVYHPQ